MREARGSSFQALAARHLVKEALIPLRSGLPGAHIPVDWDGDFKKLPEKHRANPQKREGPLKVCIVGAGACGLRVAMFLEFLGIDFDILEASDRHGGRVFTKHFTAAEHDYFDVGAMRFPHTQALEQTFNLFAELNLNLDVEIIPYIMSIDQNLQLFNNIRVTNAQAMIMDDPHNDAPHIPPACLQYVSLPLRGASAIAADAMQPFKDALAENFQIGWALLMTRDNSTTRDVMREFLFEHGLVANEAEAFWTLQWMERMNTSTQSYSLSFAQEVLESMEFDYPAGFGNDLDLGPQEWRCIDGGTEVLTDAMQQSIAERPNYNRRVVAIRAVPDPNPFPAPPEMFVKVHDHPEFDDKPYAHIVVTTPLSCMNRMDLTAAHLSYYQRDGIRSLGYGAAVKIGIKFRTRWWQDIPGFQQAGGVSYTDRPIRVVVYPSYGVNNPDLDQSTVLIASYTWTQDASRLGADIHGNNSVPEQHLLDIVYNNLAAMHNVNNLAVGDPNYRSPRWYKDETISHFAHDWYHDEFTAGAYAQFLPSQYNRIYPTMTVPAASGYLHISGEAMSAHHAWIEGALVAAWRSVYHILLFEGDAGQVAAFVDNWPPPDEIDIEQEPWHAALALGFD